MSLNFPYLYFLHNFSLKEIGLMFQDMKIRIPKHDWDRIELNDKQQEILKWYRRTQQK